VNGIVMSIRHGGGGQRPPWRGLYSTRPCPSRLEQQIVTNRNA
jgi:hypothetical protein